MAQRETHKGQSLIRRRIIRERVVQALYAHEIGGDAPEHVISCVLAGLESNALSFEFARRMFLETLEHRTEIDRILKANLGAWDLKRVAVLDRLILRLAICELVYFEEIPTKVSVNEAIELAKLFSTEKSGQFVNGVLHGILKSLTESGEISKAGRGLYTGEAPGGHRGKPHT